MKYKIDYDYEYENEKFIQCMIRGFADLKAQSEAKSDYEMLSKLIDIEDAIYNSGFSKRIIRILELYTGGFLEREIAEIMGVSQQAVNLNVKEACKMISKYLVKRKVNELEKQYAT